MLNRQYLRATETSEYETGNPTCCNRRMVRYKRIPEYRSLRAPRRIGGQDDKRSF